MSSSTSDLAVDKPRGWLKTFSRSMRGSADVSFDEFKSFIVGKGEEDDPDGLPGGGLREGRPEGNLSVSQHE